MKRPNILFLFPDQWRHDWTEFNPDLALHTPNLRRLAERGVRFSDVVCPSPVCAPSRACMAMGVEYQKCPVPNNQFDLPLEAKTFYQSLRQNGYHTMGCGKFDLHKASHRWGLDGKTDIDAWGFCDGIDNEGKIDAFIGDREGQRGPYMHYLEQNGWRTIHNEDHEGRTGWSTHPTPLPEEAYCDNWVGQNGLDLIDKAPNDKPWFLQVNFTGPHSPWDVTERMWKSVQDRNFPDPVHSKKPNDPRALDIRRNYAAMLENIDRWVGIYLDRLQEQGQLENTLIVFSSDHGEMLLDFDLWGKCVWRHGSTNVPLIITGPGVQPGQIVSHPTALLDVVGTLLESAGLEIPDSMDTRSLRPVLRGEKSSVREHIRTALHWKEHKWSAVIDRKWKLVSTDDRLLLFDREADPEEVADVHADHAEVVEKLVAQLQTV